MLPDIVYNQDSRGHELEGMSLDEMEEADGGADLLLILGTSLATSGATKLAKSLAKKVHGHGGVVVYIDRGQLPKSKWSRVVDIQLEVNIEEWAEDMLSLLSSVSSLALNAARQIS
jgi:NAD-dependent SIR2 family protein deacetylase